MTDTKMDLDAIEAAAKAATPGPWRRGTNARHLSVVADNETGIDDPGNIKAYGGHLVAESLSPTNRDFIATASPDVVLALVARVREAEGLLDRAEATCSPYTRDLIRAHLARGGGR